MTPTFVLTKEEMIAKWMMLLLPMIFLSVVLLSHWRIRTYLIGSTEIPAAFFLILYIVVASILGLYLSSSRFFTKNGPPFFRYAVISLALSLFFGFLDGFLYVLFGACGPFAGPFADCGFGPGEGDVVLHGGVGVGLSAFKWSVIFMCALIVMLLIRWNTAFQKKYSHGKEDKI